MLVLFSLFLLGLLAKRTPFGIFPDECVHKVPSGSFVENVGDFTFVTHDALGGRIRLPPCSTVEKRQFPADYDGWLAYTSFEHKPTLDAFLGSFSVPNDPESSPDELYIFTGLQNVNWIPKVDPEPQVFDIIQPVLQYPSDSGSGWSVKSWYVTLNAGVLYTDEISCSAKDIIFGNMTRLEGNDWYIAGVNTRTNEVAALTVSHTVLRLQPWAYTTVECYGCSDCSYLPTNQLSFTKMSLSAGGKAVTPTWKTYQTPNPKCHTTAHVVSAQEVYYTFQ